MSMKLMRNDYLVTNLKKTGTLSWAILNPETFLPHKSRFEELRKANELRNIDAERDLNNELLDDGFYLLEDGKRYLLEWYGTPCYENGSFYFTDSKIRE